MTLQSVFNSANKSVEKKYKKLSKSVTPDKLIQKIGLKLKGNVNITDEDIIEICRKYELKLPTRPRYKPDRKQLIQKLTDEVNSIKKSIKRIKDEKKKQKKQQRLENLNTDIEKLLNKGRNVDLKRGRNNAGSNYREYGEYVSPVGESLKASSSSIEFRF